MNENDHDQYECERRYYQTPQAQESSLTIKWWALIVVVLSIFAFFFLTILTHESRLTKIETITTLSLFNIERSIGDLKTTLERHEQRSGTKE